MDYLFFTKNSEWGSECEIRLIYFSNKNENEYCTIRNSLTNIYLGVDFHNSYLTAIDSLINGSNIEVIGTDYGDIGLIFKA